MKPSVSCLETQTNFFETRILRRVADPTFKSPHEFPGELTSPLLLYGEWYLEGFWQGLRWLSTFVFNLPYPCILLPPFGIGNLDPILGLSTQLVVRAANFNDLVTLPEGTKIGLERQNLRVQTDFVFEGPAGKHLILTGSGVSAMVMLQPKNTSTPLLLCGSRLLSASGLSDDEDRLTMIHTILDWALMWHRTEIKTGVEGEPKEILDESRWNTICIIMAGVSTTNPKEIVALANSILGVELQESEVQQALGQLQSLGMVEISEQDLTLKMENLEQYAHDRDLWAYVRVLRKEFGKDLSK